MDYTNLNDACPKDTFPLPRIDQIVDVTADHDPDVLIQRGKYRFHNLVRHVLLQGNAVWIKELRGHLSAYDVSGF